MIDWKKSFIDYFKSGEKNNSDCMLGVEVEHFILDSKSKKAVPYSGENGVRKVLKQLMSYYPDSEMLQDDEFFGFAVPDFTVTLEPASQLEISISPNTDIYNIEMIYTGFRNNLDSVLKEYGYEALNAGCQPVSRVSDLEMIPKRRYRLMNDHFLKTGTAGMKMMRGTASLQISIDYHSEDDFRKKIQTAYYYGPVLKLLTDNSSSFQGVKTDMCLKRTDIWNNVDPARCGILPNVFSDYYGYSDYADYLGSVLPIFIKKENEVIPVEETVSDIYRDRKINNKEIEHVLSMVFPDVRLKKVLEIRFSDSVPLPYITAYCALIKGMFYSKAFLDHSEKQISEMNISNADIIETEKDIMKNGWKSKIYGRTAADAVNEILQTVRGLLSDEDRSFLDPFDFVVKYGGIINIPEDEYRKIKNMVA